MTKLEKLQKEYRKTMFDLMTEDGSPEMHDALFKKLKKLENDIQQEQINTAMRGRKNE